MNSAAKTSRFRCGYAQTIPNASMTSVLQRPGRQIHIRRSIHDVEKPLDIRCRVVARLAGGHAGLRSNLSVKADHDRGVARARQRHGYNHASLWGETVGG